jgi:phenylpropionate dioxygenase-like ring-hydroxylating dioxygenase large terminal subunit
MLTPSRAIEDALRRYRPGWTLEQFFYTNEELFEYERRTWLARQWYLIAHVSEVPKIGSYIVRELLGESLIIVRTAGDAILGFFNVCRHRGSRICREDGTATVFTCPYHAWSYSLDGRLRGATALIEGSHKSELGLKPVQLTETGGLLFCTLDPAAAKLDAAAAFLPGLEYQGVPGARIAARRQYPTAANWKLVIENFLECYHCLPAHPQYSALMGHVKRYSVDSAAQAAEWNREVDEWVRTEAIVFPGAVFETADAEWGLAEITRFPIGAGCKTQSENGQPVAPLMGQYPKYDGGVAHFSVPPFAYFFGLNDHAVLFQFLPRAAEYTDVTVTWLVDAAAPPEAVDVERMVWLWDVTTLQDKDIIEANAAGVRSCAYEPGRYSKLEQWGVPVLTQYITELRAQSAAGSD